MIQTPSRRGPFARLCDRARGDDRGVALVTAMMIMMVLTAIGATVALVGINNMQNASLDRAAESSLGAGDAGVASGIEYLRNNGVGSLRCYESNVAACSANAAGYSNPTNPKLVPLDSAGVGCNAGGKNCARVWIGIVQAFAPPTVKVGTYNIHSEGVYGPGPSARNIVSTVKVTPDKFPIGVFGESLSGNGGTSLYTESLFTRDCVSPLYTGSGNGTRFTGIDSYWGQPAAAHSTNHLSTSNSCGANGYVHKNNAPCPNNTTLNGMQSGDGAVVPSGSQCYHTYQRPDGSWFPDGTCPTGVTSTRTDGLCDTTAFTTADLQRYGYRPRGLTDAQYAGLKARAQGTGTYNVSVGSLSTKLTAALAAGINDPVLYWDCSASGSNCSSGNVALHYNDFPANKFDTAPVTSGNCADPYQIVTIVVEHGSLSFQGGNNTWFDGAMFVPDGSFDGNGGYNINGTLFSNNLSLGGNQGWDLDSCWVTNFPGAVISVTQSGFREDDAKNAP